MTRRELEAARIATKRMTVAEALESLRRAHDARASELGPKWEEQNRELERLERQRAYERSRWSR